MITHRSLTAAVFPLVIISVSLVAGAQTERALDRRLDRNARQMQRQANRTNYYGDKEWNSLTPWIQQNRIAPLKRAANNAANAVANTANKATRAFGYADANAPSWFYDYYTYRPTYYYTPNTGEQYLGAIRYFDRDNDGIYESNAFYQDSDSDGIYDQYSRHDFDQTDEANEETNRTGDSDPYQGPSDARRYSMQGEIAMTKSAKVNGTEHLLVAVTQEGEDDLAIDLGPAEQLKGKQVEVGARLEASGPVEQIGEKRVLIADSAAINGNPLAIRPHFSTTIQGDIVDIRQVEIGGKPHYMAIVEADKQRHLVDLGATSSFRPEIQKGSPIVIYGVPVQTHGYQVLMANRVQLGQNEVIDLNRSQSYSF